MATKLKEETLFKITVARAQMVKKEPFFGYLSLFLEPTKWDEQETFATDGKRLFIHEGFAEKLSIEDTKFIFAHEVLHIALDHLTRRGERNHKLWNAAIDFAANGLLIDEGFKMPTGKGKKGLYDSQFDKMPAEEIYDKLKAEVEKNGGEMPESNFDVHIFLDENGDDKDGKSSEGKGIRVEINGKPVQLNKEATEQLQKEIITAARMSMAQGKCPGFAEAIVKELTTPKINWKKVLYRFLQENTAMNDYSFSRLKRQYMAQGMAVPSMRSKEPPPIAVAIDNSGSISDKCLCQFITEIQAFARLGWNFPVHIFVCDAEIKFYKKIFARAINYKDIKVNGRGGTDFRPVFDKIKEDKTHIACLIYLTDTYGRFPDKKPDYPVLWISVAKDGKVPFGQLIYMDLAE